MVEKDEGDKNIATVVDLKTMEIVGNGKVTAEEIIGETVDLDLSEQVDKKTIVAGELAEAKKKFGEVGTVLRLKNSQTVVLEKYLVTSKGIPRVAFCNQYGDRRVFDVQKFEEMIKNAGGYEKSDLTKESNSLIERVQKLDKKLLKKIDKIANKKKLDIYDKKLQSLIDKLLNLRDDVDNKEASVDDLANIYEVFERIVELDKEVEDVLEEQQEQQKRQEFAGEKRKETFNKKFGVDEDYVLVAKNENGHEFSQKSFTVIEYIIGDGAEKDSIKIKWHNEDGIEEEISRRKFFALIKEGYKKEKEIQQKQKRVNNKSKKVLPKKNGEDTLNIKETEEKAKKYRDEYFEKMDWGKKSINKGVDDDLVGDLELADKFAKESDDEKNFIDQSLERNLEEILKNNPEIEKEVVRKTLNPETREISYDKADLKDKVLMLLGKQSNQSRRKYLEKDYDMDRRLGGIKRFFGKTFKIGNFEEEINSYKENYEIAREKYKNAILELEGVDDREEMDILARDFQISEQLRWRSDSLDIAIENNPAYENSKKFLLGAVNKYREMRKWPSDKISELFGFKGLSKGVGIVSGMLITGKILKEVGMVGNPAFRVFSVAISSVGYKQGLETMAEKRRLKKGEKEIKKAVNKFGVNFEATRNIDEFSEWLTEKNNNLDKNIQDEKYWRKWRTAMSGGLAVGTFFGGSLLSEEIMKHFGGHSLNNGDVNSGKMEEKVEKLLGDNKVETEKILNSVTSPTKASVSIESPAGSDIIEEPFPINSDEGSIPENNIEADVQIADKRIISDGNAKFRGVVEMNKTESPMNQDDLHHQDSSNSENSKVSQNNVPEKTIDIANPNLEQHRNITGSEIQIANGLGFTPAEYARLNDVLLAQITDVKINRLWAKAGMKMIDPNTITLGEFFRQLDIDKLSENSSLSEMTDKSYIEYLASVINYETMDIKKVIVSGNIEQWNEMKNNLAIGELDEKFSKFYSEISTKFSLYARPTESVERWITRLTKFSYDRGILSEVKQNLEEIISKK